MSKKKINIASVDKPNFKTPEGYLDNLPNRIEARIADLERSNIETVDLYNLPKTSPFTTPEHYFDNLPTQIQSKATSESKTTLGVASWTRLAWTAPAFIVLLAIGYIMVFNDTDITRTPDELLAEVGTEELVAYLEKSELSTEELLLQLDLVSLEDDFDELNSDLLDEVELSDDDLEILFNEYEISEEIL